MKIRLKTRGSGPKGQWAVGDEVVVGRDLSRESADHLLASGQATLVVERLEEVETAEAAPAEENAAKATTKPKARRGRKKVAK